MQPNPPINLESLPVIDSYTAPPRFTRRVSPATLQAHAALLLLAWAHLPPKIALAEVVAVLMREHGVSDRRAMHNARVAQKRLETDRRKP